MMDVDTVILCIFFIYLLSEYGKAFMCGSMFRDLYGIYKLFGNLYMFFPWITGEYGIA